VEVSLIVSEADVGFGVPTRVFNGPSLDDPRSIGSRAMYEVRTEHDFTGAPCAIALGSDGSLLAGLGAG